MNKQSQQAIQFTISLNGIPSEEIKPYAKGSVIMLPLRHVAQAMGYSVDHDEKSGVSVMYRSFIYERKTLTVRYLYQGESIASYYYYYNGEFLNEPAAELIDGELYIPLGVFAKIGCTCAVTGSGEINITCPNKAV